MPEDKKSYHDNFIQLETAMAETGPGAHLNRTSVLYQLLMPHMDKSTPLSKQRRESFQRLLPIIKYINENLGSSLTIPMLSEHLNIHPEYFSRLFRKTYNISPNQYILQRRIRHAQKLLSDESLQIKEISDQCGFNDQYYFSKAFKKISGVSPSAYRKYN